MIFGGVLHGIHCGTLKCDQLVCKMNNLERREEVSHKKTELIVSFAVQIVSSLGGF